MENKITKEIKGCFLRKEISENVYKNSLLVYNNLFKKDKLKDEDVYTTEYGTLCLDWIRKDHCDNENDFSLEIGKKTMGYFSEVNEKTIDYVEEVEINEKSINKLDKNLKKFYKIKIN